MNPSLDAPSSTASRLAPIRRFFDRIVAWVDAQTAFRRRIPIRARVALFGAGVVAATVVVFGVAVYYLVEGNLVAQQETSLSQRGDQIWVSVERARGVPRVISPFAACDLNSSADVFLQLLSSTQASQGSTCTVKGIEPQWPSSAFDSVPVDRGVIKVVQPNNGPLVRAYIRAWTRPDFGSSGYMIVGQPTFAIEDQLAGLRAFLLLGALLSLFVAGAASWLVAGRALRPLDAMASTAEDIGRTQDLSRRLPENAPNDEVGRLQHSFNQMLRQLEDAYLRLRSALVAQRRFVADASHELRTP